MVKIKFNWFGFFIVFLFSQGAWSLDWWTGPLHSFDTGDAIACPGQKTEMLALYENHNLPQQNSDLKFDVRSFKYIESLDEGLDLAYEKIVKKNKELAQQIKKNVPTILQQISFVELSFDSKESSYDRFYWRLGHNIRLGTKTIRMSFDTCTFSSVYKLKYNFKDQSIAGYLVNKEIWQELDILNKVYVIIELAFLSSWESGSFDHISGDYNDLPGDTSDGRYNWLLEGEQYYLIRYTLAGLLADHMEIGAYQWEMSFNFLMGNNLDNL